MRSSSASKSAARIIVDETLLREGKEYSEDEVRNAMARLNRLPFLASADYALQNGVLVINVTEVRRFSFLVDARGIALHDDQDPHSTNYDFPDPTAEWTNAAAGVRWLGGGGGIAHFGMTVLRNRHAFGKNYSAYELGYTEVRAHIDAHQCQRCRSRRVALLGALAGQLRLGRCARRLGQSRKQRQSTLATCVPDRAGWVVAPVRRRTPRARRTLRDASARHDTPTDENRRSYEAAASWVRRGVWGTLRLGVAYEKGN